MHTISGTVRLPGSKSLSNRALLLAALAEGRTIVENLLDSDDVRYMVSALGSLGVPVDVDWSARRAVVDGCGGTFGPGGPDAEHPLVLFLGNAGTAMRPLAAAVAAAGRGHYVLDGVSRMRERPIQDLVDGLVSLGADVSCAPTGCPPVSVSSSAERALPGGEILLGGGTSSQYLTAILMSAPLAQSADVRTKAKDGVLISQPYVDMTLRLMERFGVRSERLDGLLDVRVPRGQTYVPPADGVCFVEGDASSASYFLAGAAITGGTIRVEGCGSESLQGDVRFAEVLEQMGCEVTFEPRAITLTGPSSPSSLVGGTFDCIDIPDAAMTLAPVALFASSPVTVTGVGSWRVKETERMKAIVAESEKLGAHVAEGTDWITIEAPRLRNPSLPAGPSKDAAIETYDDHRMAMAFALAACGEKQVTILDPGCTRKTFPTYFDVLKEVSQ